MSAAKGPDAPLVVVVRDADILAASAATLLLSSLVDAQARRESASVVLTGGGIGIALLEQVRCSPARDAVDWRRVDLWWGDERFVPQGHPDRNEQQARAALLDSLDLDPARVHAIAASDGPAGEDPDVAAELYAAELAAADPSEGAPLFDVLLLGVGGEGHVASIFPGSPAEGDDRLVVAVRDCPKPPPTRVSLGLAALNRAREVWFVVAGAAKAEAVVGALRGELPAGQVHGLDTTRWLLDRSAAGLLPAED